MLIELRNVRYVSDNFTLQIPSFTLNDGELLLVVGRNGSGKTTLCKIIAGILTTEDGVHVTDPQNLTLCSPNPVMVWQDLELFPLTVEGNLRVVNREAATALLDQFKLLEYKDRPVEKLSGGYRERVALARAAAVPGVKVLAFDEPTKSADKERVKEFAREVGDILKTKKAVVVVSHDERLVGEISRLVTGVYVIDDHSDGERRTSSLKGPFSTTDLFTRPATAFAARFAGYENIFQLLDERRALSFHNLGPLLSGKPTGQRIVVIPWTGLKLALKAQLGSVEVRVGAPQFRANGAKIVSCGWIPDGGSAPLEFIAPYTEELRSASTGFLSLIASECFEIVS